MLRVGHYKTQPPADTKVCFFCMKNKRGCVNEQVTEINIPGLLQVNIGAGWPIVTCPECVKLPRAEKDQAVNDQFLVEMMKDWNTGTRRMCKSQAVFDRIVYVAQQTDLYSRLKKVMDTREGQ